MFSPDDILTLSKAGFNAQQIAGLSMLANKQPEQAPAPAAPAPAPAAPAPAPAPAAPAPAAPAPAAPAPAAPEVDPVLAELQKLTGLMMSSNIINTEQPKVETAEDILASIINPKPIQPPNNN